MAIKDDDNICLCCKFKHEILLDFVSDRNITIVTMGPYGTTSSVAANYLQNYLYNNSNVRSVEIMLFDTFETALEKLKKCGADMIILPNAYDKMTRFYWDTNMMLLKSFVIHTPFYGIAAMDKNALIGKESLKVSSCRAVMHILDDLIADTEFRGIPYEIVEAYSTKKSLMLLENGEVDLALTNDTSLCDSKAEFISSRMHTEVLWSVFVNKKDMIKADDM